MVPINYKFVTYQTISTASENGEAKPLTILVLDEAANTAYWKVINCFTSFLQSLKLSGPEQAKQWLISTAFAAQEAYQDLVHDLESDPYQTNGPTEPFKIYDIPVNYVEDERPYCVLQLADDSLLENELWK